MKKFWKYFTLTILFLLGLCCVGILYLFFVPGSSLFGICYVSFSEYHLSKPYAAADYSTINLISNNYDVRIVECEEEEITVRVYTNSLGFISTKNKETIISQTQNVATETVTFEIKEPTGFAFKNSSYVELQIPANKEFNLTLKNNKAETIINNSTLKIKNLSYTTNSGNFYIDNASLSGDINLTLNKATCTVSSSVVTNNNNVTLKLTSGSFKATNSIFKDIFIKENARGVILVKECSNINEEITSAGGRIEIETVSFANIKSSSSNIYIKEILNGASITLTENGSVSINELTGRSSISTNAGDITINTLNSYLDVTTKNGDITINNAKDKVNISTKYGTANVNFDEKATSKFLSATLDDGQIIASGVEQVNIVITGNGRADLNMSNVVGLSSIEGNTGSVYVKINKLSKYKLTTKSEGSVRVNLAQIPNYGGYTTKEETTTYVNCSSTTYGENVLDVSTTSGDLTILDTNFA